MILDLLNAASAQLDQVGPIIADVLASDLAQPVTFQRFGQPSEQLRSVIGQEEDRSTDAPDVHEPGISSRSFTALLPYHEAALTPGWTLTDATGRIHVPVAPVLNPAGRNLFLVARVAPLVERTRVHDLAFGVPGQGMVQDSLGNRKPAPGGTLAVQARLSAATDPKLRDTVGADNADLVLIGRWGSLTAPTSRPDGVRWGSQSPLVIDGQAGTLTVQLAYPDEDTATEAQFGQRFLALWRTP
ncbi:hypothetical protein [Deinococcus sp. 12RED42]|uniref:hypothetical protein n=1 Tax=Deinococcus sp. 12RED42 TaxID=2745872 RepID=UPI001E5EC7C9|nr:hypothetical protein [Deinococcus sp. 12RED42]MCD0165254.1 hypothetical protein [Deinococcus sp. 12RED42]